MRHNKTTKKYFVVFLLISQLLAYPGLAFAQLGGLTPVPTSDSANGSGGLTGTIANGVASGVLAGISAANQACATSEQAYFKADSAVQMGFGGLALISGGAALSAQLKAKNTAIDGFITCRESVRSSLTGVAAPNTYVATQKQALLNDVTQAIASLKVRQDPIKAQMNLVDQGFWKTLVFNILIKTTKSISANLVNRLVSNYKISNYTQYADALATQVYDTAFIEKNYPQDKRAQMLVYAMMNNDVSKGGLHPAVVQATDEALGFDYKKLDVNSENFYADAASTGAGYANPFLQQTIYAAQAETIKGQSLTAAKAEIAQSNGLKTPMNCAGSVGQQQDLAQRFKLASDEVSDRQQLLESLNSYQKTAKNLTAEQTKGLNDDIAKAQADLNAANLKLSSLPKSVNKGVVDICQSIVSPPSLINKGIDQAFKAMGDKLGNYDNNNLPFFINFISDVANQIGNNLIFGGGMSSSQVLQEKSAGLASATGMAVAYAATQSKDAIEKGIQFSDPVKSGNGLNSYTLSWDVGGSKMGDASYVSITDTGANKVLFNRLPISGSIEVTSNNNTTYVLKVYDKNGKELGSSSVELDMGSVQGAYASRLSVPIRGPVGIQPRGEE